MKRCWILSKAFSASTEWHVISVIHCIYVLFCIYWFAYVPLLTFLQCNHLDHGIWSFNVLLNLSCKHFIDDFASMFIKDIGLLFFFFVVSLSSFGIRVIQVSLSGFRSVPLPFYFME
jgi:hypothetical protein